MVRSGPFSSRVVLTALTLLTSSLGVRSAGAEPTTWLSWVAPNECQNTTEVERRLAFLLGQEVDAASLPSTRVQMGWSAERGWAVRVSVALTGGARERALHVPTCSDVFDVVALSLALVLDPDFREDDVLGGALEGAEAEGAHDGSSDAAPGPPVSGNTPEPDGALAPAADTTADGRASADAGATGTGPDPAARPASPPFTVSVAGAALTELNLFPVPQFGGALQLAVRRAAWRIELEGALLASESAILPRAQHPVSFTSRFGGLRGCYQHAFGERLVWVGCGGGELGALTTRELGGEGRHPNGLWAAAQLSTGPEFAATGWLRAFASARAVAPLLRHRFVLSDGASVHELPAIGAEVRVGVAVDVTEFGGRGH